MKDSRLIQLSCKSFFPFLLNRPLDYKSFLVILHVSSMKLILQSHLSCLVMLQLVQGREIKCLSLTVDGKFWHCLQLVVTEGDSPVMESLHIVPQSGSQMSYTHLLLLQRSEVLLRLWSPDPMVVAAAGVLHLTPGSTSREMICRRLFGFNSTNQRGS